jgi:hypothetical protein
MDTPDDSNRGQLAAWLNHTLDMMGTLAAVQREGGPRRVGVVQERLCHAATQLAEVLSEVTDAGRRSAID